MVNVNEIWKEVSGYEGIYKVSNYGRLWSEKRKKILRVHPNNSGKGYMITILRDKEGKAKSVLIHRLVAEAFIPNPEKKKEVNHKDENPRNNRLSNLEWATRSENINYGTRNKRASDIMKFAMAKKVLQLDEEMNVIKEWDSAREAGDSLGICASCIRDCCTGRRKAKHAGGYRWKYKEEN